MKTDKTLNDYEQFLTNNFVNTRTEWEKYIDLIAYEFLNSFYDNLSFMNSQMKIVNKRKNATISYKEQVKLKRILNVFALFDMIEINSEQKKIFVDINKINKAFSQVTSAKERIAINESIEELDSSFNNQEENKISFSDLYRKYNFLISYVKNDKLREAFFRENLLQDKKADLNLLLNDNLYSTKTI